MESFEYNKWERKKELHRFSNSLTVLVFLISIALFVIISLKV